MEIDGVGQLDPQAAADRVRDGALLVDVREASEHARARIPGSTFLPLHEIPERFAELPKDRLLILQCASGIRSQQAARFLQSKGYDVANLTHGIQGWHRMGLDVDVGPP